MSWRQLGLFRHDGPLSFNLFKENFWSGRIYVASAVQNVRYCIRLLCSRRSVCRNIVSKIRAAELARQQCFMSTKVDNKTKHIEAAVGMRIVIDGRRPKLIYLLAVQVTMHIWLCFTPISPAFQNIYVCYHLCGL